MAVEVLLISGSLRGGSINTAVLRTAAAAAPEGVRAIFYEGLGGLPLFNPDDDEPGRLAGAVADLRARLRAADALLFCTPEYAGGLPGSFKNLLDWSIGGGEVYGKHAAWINATSRPDEEALRGAYESLRSALGYAGMHVVDAACRRVRVTQPSIGADGLIAPGPLREEIAESLALLAAEVAREASGEHAPPAHCGLAHVEVAVSSLARSVDFYRGLLAPLGYTEHQDLGGAAAESGHRLSVPGRFEASLWLRESAVAGPPEAGPGGAEGGPGSAGPGVRRLCFSAASRAHVDEAHRWLQAHGAEVEGPPREHDLGPGYYAVRFRDPDGLGLEVAHRPAV